MSTSIQSLVTTMESADAIERTRVLVSYAFAERPKDREALAIALGRVEFEFAVMSALEHLAADSEPRVRAAAMRAVRNRRA